MRPQTIEPFNEQGNFVATHNLVYDYIMPRISGNAFKVLCLIIRQTKGRQKKSDEISYSQLRDGTGIKSDATIFKSLEELLGGGYILRKAGEKQRYATRYALNKSFSISTAEIVVTTETVVKNGDLSTTETVANSTTETVAKSTTETVETERQYKNNKDNSTPIGVRAAPKNPISESQKTAQPADNEIPKPEGRKKQKGKAEYTPGGMVPLDDEFHVALRRFCKCTNAATTTKQQATEEAARVLIENGATTEELGVVIGNYWEFKPTTAAFYGRSPTPEQVRDGFDDWRDMHLRQPGQAEEKLTKREVEDRKIERMIQHGLEINGVLPNASSR